MNDSRPLEIPGSLPVETRAPASGEDEDRRLAAARVAYFSMEIGLQSALCCANLARYHMNEGHASLLVLELLHELVQKEDVATATRRHVDAIRPRCVFTTHTAVPAGRSATTMRPRWRTGAPKRMKLGTGVRLFLCPGPSFIDQDQWKGLRSAYR